MRLAPMLLCACGVTTDPVGSQDTASPAAEPIPVVLNDGWVVYPATRPISVGPYDGAPPMLLEMALRPDDLLLRVQAELDLYPTHLLRERIDAVVIGTQLSQVRTPAAELPRGMSSPDNRLVFLGAEYMTLRQMPKTLHHEIGHVLYQLISDEDFAQWQWLSDYGDPRSYLDHPRAGQNASEDWAAYVSMLRNEPDRLQAKACRIPDVATKVAFVQRNLAALGVTLDRTVDVNWCVSYAD